MQKLGKKNGIATLRPAAKGGIVRFLPFYLMALPALLYMLVNNFMPLYGMLLAFKKLNVRKGIWGSPWSGLTNFEFLFSSNRAFIIIRNTVLYNLAFIVLGTIVSVTLAILLNEVRNKRMTKLYQSIILIPYLISWVIASYLAYAFLSDDVGILNSWIVSLGGQKVSWYMEKSKWPVILFLVSTWKNSGYMMVIYYSTVVGISQDYYEAALIDGATKWQQIKNITLPLMKGTIVTMVVLAVGRICSSDFGLFYQIPRNSGALYDYTQTIDVYVYNALMKNNDFGLSSAASVFQSVVGFAFILGANAFLRRFSREDALF